MSGRRHCHRGGATTQPVVELVRGVVNMTILSYISDEIERTRIAHIEWRLDAVVLLYYDAVLLRLRQAVPVRARHGIEHFTNIWDKTGCVRWVEG